MKIYRQGDVLIKKVVNMPKDILEINRDEQGRIVLAYGEVTGHAHAIHNRLTKFFEETTTKRRFLEIPQRTRIVHEEHAPINLEIGTYEVIRQREWTDDNEPIQVAD